MGDGAPFASVEALATMLRRYAQELPPEDVPAFVGALESAKAHAWTRLAPPTPATHPNGCDAGLLDAGAMAERLHVGVSWLREAARHGRIPSVHVGRYIRFDPAAVLHAIRARPAP